MRTFTYEVSDLEFPNPERGWMVWSGRQSAQSVFDDARIISGLVRVDFELNDFRESAISGAWLSTLDTYFNRVRTAGLKTIPHFEYCQGIGQDDTTKAWILSHVTQLTPYLQAHADVIALMWAGFIGPWGEWHNSTNDLLNDVDMTDILNAVLAATPTSVPVAIRHPGNKLIIFDDEVLDSVKAFNGSNIARVGHVNLAILATDNDYNTYGEDIEGEKDYVSAEALYVPTGGESANTQNINCVDIPLELERLRWSYMSDTYHPDAIDILEGESCWGQIGKNLGYRLSLLELSCDGCVSPGKDWTFQLTINNSGYAPPYNERPLYLIIDGITRTEITLASDPRQWGPGNTTIQETVTMPDSLLGDELSIYLWLPDPDESLKQRTEYSIRLANQDLWSADLGANLIVKLKPGCWT